MRHLRTCLVAIALLGVSHGAFAQQTQQPLRVAAAPLAPCVIDGADGQMAGFAVDLWAALADAMDVTWDIDAHPVEMAMQRLADGQADVVIGCVSVNAGREALADFTHPVAPGGLLPVSRRSGNLVPHFSDRSETMLLILFGILLCFANLIWWSERGRDAISDQYLPGVFQALWFSLVTMSTVGYGDVTPQRWIGRITASLLILLGVTAFGVIFGQFAADATRSVALHPVERLADLRRYRVATKENTATGEILAREGVLTEAFPTVADAVDAVERGVADIAIHDAVAMRHALQTRGDLTDAGPVLARHDLAFAVRQGSPLREDVNRALLRLRESGQYGVIRDRWL